MKKLSVLSVALFCLVLINAQTPPRSVTTARPGTTTLDPSRLSVSVSVTDIDGNVYPSVKIGTQIWMTKNLRVTKLNDGTPIDLIQNVNGWDQAKPRYCWYTTVNDPNNAKYGALYNWYSVNTGKLCPEGWHVPSDAEWTIMEDYLVQNGYSSGTSSDPSIKYIAKALAATSDWASSSYPGSVGNTDLPELRNKSGFTALPGGSRSVRSVTSGKEGYAQMWTSTESGEYQARARSIAYNGSTITAALGHKMDGRSVRCVKNR